ncbi:hypothetical protein [Priestia megaterium]|uniref:hypothetical protein n=1 Tax=Priestia megaterium TaxID=1404 RepID=UPI002813F8FB|nr:hypothetical protein [Priestia megaterium]MDR0128679.1 hypothetical protein [Priestia megaterium]MED4234414.1 hypothetical protein [Priestia megaterium]
MKEYILEDKYGKKKLDVEKIIQALKAEGIEAPPLLFIQYDMVEWDVFQDGEKRFVSGADIFAEKMEPLRYSLNYTGVVTNRKERERLNLKL